MQRFPSYSLQLPGVLASMLTHPLTGAPLAGNGNILDEFVPAIGTVILAAIEVIQHICIQDEPWADRMIESAKE